MVKKLQTILEGYELAMSLEHHTCDQEAGEFWGEQSSPFTLKGVAFYASCFILMLSMLCIQVVKSNGILVKEVLMDKVSRLCNGVYSEVR